MQRVSNHPVHIIDEDGKLSPSSFIPFCMFGRNMSALENKNSKFHDDIPICNIFKDRVFNNQTCYEIDLHSHKVKDRDSTEEDLKLGLSFVMDYNEDRQVYLGNDENDLLTEIGIWKDITVDGSNDDKNAIIYLNTIGIH